MKVSPPEAPTLDVREAVKFYNVGHKSSETYLRRFYSLEIRRHNSSETAFRGSTPLRLTRFIFHTVANSS